MDECVFCKVFEQGPKKILYENESFFSIPDVKPIIKGHSLVISKKHFKTILDLPNMLGDELMDCIKNTALKIIKETNSEGFNVIVNNYPSAGQVVHHIHLHIIPRKEGDELKGKLFFH